MKDEFYIGWNDNIPQGYKKVLFGFFGLAILVGFGLTLIWVSNTTPFSNSIFEYGNQREYTGILRETPVPMLEVDTDTGNYSMPLVNFGKAGVNEPMAFFKSQMRNDLPSYRVHMRGTLISFDNRPWLELTDGNSALLEFERLDEPKKDVNLDSLSGKSISLTGEIVDPKCFFGVMKPGFGKVHLSCAVRCIAGGIPPVFVVPDEEGNRSYYFLSNQAEEPVNQLVMSYVGLPVQINGLHKRANDWQVIEIDNESLSWTSMLQGPSIFEECSNEYIAESYNLK